MVAAISVGDGYTLRAAIILPTADGREIRLWLVTSPTP
jgi:hypothetical protein